MAFGGQFFDLHDLFVRWVNLPQCKGKQLDYSDFLRALGKFDEIPEQEKVRRVVGRRAFAACLVVFAAQQDSVTVSWRLHCVVVHPVLSLSKGHIALASLIGVSSPGQ